MNINRIRLSNPIEKLLEKYGEILQGFIFDPQGLPIAASDINSVFARSRFLSQTLDQYLNTKEPEHVLLALQIQLIKWVAIWEEAKQKAKIEQT